MVSIMGTDTRTVIRQRAQKLMALMDGDEHLTGRWYDEVDLTTLDIGDPSLCLFGQLFGGHGMLGYLTGLEYFGQMVKNKVVPRGNEWAVDHALAVDTFMVAEAAGYTEERVVEDMTAVWVELISKRRLHTTGETIAAIVAEGDEEE